MNVVGAVKTCLQLPIGSKIATVICDSGQRHVTRFWSRDFCLNWGLHWPGDLPEAQRVPSCIKAFTDDHNKR
jgi:cysteine synthase A